jgi:hypothetical protein
MPHKLDLKTSDVLRAVKKAGGNIAAAARGCSPTTVRRSTRWKATCLGGAATERSVG